MQLLAQTMMLSQLGFAGLRQRKWSSLVLVGSVACVIAVMLSMLSISAGMLRAYRSGEDSGIAMVLQSEFNSEYGTGIPANIIGTILDAPGIAKGPDGHPLGDPEVLVWIPPSGAYVNGSPMLRGIGAAGLTMRPGVRIVAGRQFHPGQHEAIIGIAAMRAFDLRVGDTITMPGGTWPIVGAFSDDGSILEGELVADAVTFTTAARASGFGSVMVRLENPAAFDTFERWIAANPQLKVIAERQSDYALRTVNQASTFFTQLTYAVGIIMAIGALFGIVKLMYAAVSVRTREIATLRAIGYQPLPVALAVLLETACLSLIGALLGAGVAWLLCNGKHVVEMRNIFALAVSPAMLTLAVACALGMALFGGLSPAVRAARLSVKDGIGAV